MAALTELKGQELGTQRVAIERGPVKVFAAAVKDGNPVYATEDAPAPPTYPFSWAFHGSRGESSVTGLPIEKLRGKGRMILHGEQEFVYHRLPKVGDVLEGKGRVADVYERERSNGGSMEFYVTDTDWTDAVTGDPVCTARFTLIVNVAPPKD
ncbi:MAG: N-terminal half of MaoC dehydratase [Acidimicrobiales bacterium]|nr:N-terminal half of MaoC dehydratase [Acidimicrobiales bacterium]